MMPIMRMSEPIQAAGGAVAGGWAWKTGSLILGWLMSLIAPVQPFLITISILVVCDMVTGIWAARKTGAPFTSSKLARTLPKIIFYPLSILISELMVFTYFQGTPVFESLTYMVALFISTVEFQSNIENIGRITGNNIWNHVKNWLVDRVRAKSGGK